MTVGELIEHLQAFDHRLDAPVVVPGAGEGGPSLAVSVGVAKVHPESNEPGAWIYECQGNECWHCGEGLEPIEVVKIWTSWGESTMEPWRVAWREGVAPALTVEQLEALREGLRENDQRLIQGRTVEPLEPPRNFDRPCERACAIGYAALRAGFLKGDRVDSPTIGEVREHFARACFEADKRLGEPGAVRWFLNWFDDAPRDEMLRELLSEVELAIVSRKRGKGIVSRKRGKGAVSRKRGKG